MFRRRTVQHVLYASGNFAKSNTWTFIELFALYYFTDILGLSAGLAGTIILISLVWDGVSDPAMGLLADRLRGRLSSLRIYFFVGTPLTALAFVSLFLAAAIPEPWRVAYVLVSLMFFRTAYTIIDIPHNSLLGFLTDDPRERTNIASMRIFFSSAGKFTVSLVSIYALSENAFGTVGNSFTLAAVGLAALYIVLMGGCLWAVWSIKIGGNSEFSAPFNPTHVVASIIANGQLTIAFGLTAITSLTTPLVGTAIIYYGKYVLEAEATGGTALSVLAFWQALGLLFWSTLSNRLAYKRVAAQWANAMLLLSMAVALVFLDSSTSLLIVASVTGFAFGGIFMLNWSILPDSLDHGSKAADRKFEISVFSLYTLTSKVCIGLSQAIAGWTLEAFSYVPNAPDASAKMSSIVPILLTWPFLGAALCIALLSKHSIRQVHSSRSQN